VAIRVILADDHPLTRAGLKAYLDSEKEIQLVGEAEDGERAWHMIRELNPDIVLLDIRMPKLDGVSVARMIREAGLSVGIVMLTSYDAQQYVMASLRSGARGFVLKTAPPDELTRAIKTVSNGGLFLDSEVAGAVGENDLMPDSISVREREVLLLAARGFSSKEVASRLYISERTVQTHLASIYDKLGARNKTESLLLALKYGVVTLEELLE